MPTAYCTPCGSAPRTPNDAFFIKHRGECAKCWHVGYLKRDLTTKENNLKQRPKYTRLSFLFSPVSEEIGWAPPEPGVCKSCGGPTKRVTHTRCKDCASKDARAFWDAEQKKLIAERLKDSF